MCRPVRCQEAVGYSTVCPAGAGPHGSRAGRGGPRLSGMNLTPSAAVAWRGFPPIAPVVTCSIQVVARHRGNTGHGRRLRPRPGQDSALTHPDLPGRTSASKGARRVRMEAARKRPAPQGAEPRVAAHLLDSWSVALSQPSMRVTVIVASVRTPRGSVDRPWLWGGGPRKARKRALAAGAVMTSRTMNFSPMFCVAPAPI